jgi:hypothetical protein
MDSTRTEAVKDVFATRSNVARRTRRFGLSLLMACAGLFASCATIDATATPYVGAPHPPPTNPANVQILRTEPTRPHVRLGEIVLEATTDPAPPIEKVEAKLREEGAKLGADAVVVVLDRIQAIGGYVSGPWWGRTVETETGSKLIGVAIKYQP